MKKLFLTMLLLLIVMVGGAAELWWSPVPGATGYTVYYSRYANEPEYSSALHRCGRTSECHVVLNCPQDVFIYVRAWNDNECGISKLSSPVYFPALPAPTNVVIK